MIKKLTNPQQSFFGLEVNETKQALYERELKRQEKEAKAKTVSIDSTDLFSGQFVNGRNVQTDLTDKGDKDMKKKKRIKPTNPDQLDMFSAQEIQKMKDKRERQKKVELARIQRTAKRIAERMYCSNTCFTPRDVEKLSQREKENEELTKRAQENARQIIQHAEDKARDIRAEAQIKIRIAERVQRNEAKQIISKAEAHSQRIQIEAEQYVDQLETLKQEVQKLEDKREFLQTDQEETLTQNIKELHKKQQELRREWSRARNAITTAKDEQETLTQEVQELENKKDSLQTNAQDYVKVNDWNNKNEPFTPDDRPLRESIIRLSQCVFSDSSIKSDQAVVYSLGLGNKKLIRPPIVQTICTLDEDESGFVSRDFSYHILEGEERLLAAKETGLKRINAYVFERESDWNEYKPQLTGIIPDNNPQTPPPTPTPPTTTPPIENKKTKEHETPVKVYDSKPQDNLFPQTVETKNKTEAQLQAEAVEVQLCDRDNIGETLPYLTDSQQEDVLKAEKLFFEANGKGMAFTNGTGTGKTYVGLGIAKRFQKRGKSNILIVVPTYAKAVDWVNDGKNLNLEITQIKGVNDGGEGIVVTTYANFRQNDKLTDREFDLVIYDESHKLNSNWAGSTTEAEFQHREIAKVPSIAYEKAKRKFDWENDDSPENMERIIAEAKRLRDSVKVVFLSATPFPYHKNLSYADGCLFNIVERKGGDKPSEWWREGDYDKFFIRNFGYRMRYNKLTMPESGVDVGLMERNFSEHLKNEGVLSCRLLEVDQDYSRDFVLVEDKLGQKIDEGMDIALGYAKRDDNNFQKLPGAVKNHFDWLAQSQLLEAIKSQHAIGRCEEHLRLGRKVVIFHTYKKGEFTHPFDFRASLKPKNDEYGFSIPPLLENEISDFHRKYPEYLKLDLTGLHNPIETFSKAFGDQVLFFNGDVPKKKRSQAIREFNKDSSGKDILVVQMEAGKEGISVHDFTGNHQRVIINLALPFKPTDAMQSEGRIYRLGVKTNAIVEYLVLKTNFESMAFGNKINKRVRTAENLAFGNQSRNFEESFAGGYLNANHTSELLPVDMTGQGGVLADGKMNASSPFEQAKTFYFARLAGRNNNGVDYFATPEPLGMKMVEWANAQVNEDLLEPSAGHGAIARFFPKFCHNVFVEPEPTLAAEVAIVAGEPHVKKFEDLHVTNKYDVIVMNPPFGKAGKTAMEHLKKAFDHLRFNGRVVAILPTGSTDKKFDRWYKSEEYAYKVADIALPSCTFSRAGTKVATRIVVLDKCFDSESAPDYPDKYDLQDAQSVNELFDRIEEIDVEKRNIPRFESEEVDNEAPVEIKKWEKPVSQDKDVILKVPFIKKNYAKGLGCKWNRKDKVWYWPKTEGNLPKELEVYLDNG
jgi:hypothetical protein